MPKLGEHDPFVMARLGRAIHVLLWQVKEDVVGPPSRAMTK